MVKGVRELQEGVWAGREKRKRKVEGEGGVEEGEECG